MKKNLHHLWLLLVGVLITFSAQQARASHAIGGDMSYVNVGPGLYFVQYRFYRDCSGIPAPGQFTLNFSATGCGPNNVANPGDSETLLPRGSAVGNPYCTTQNNQSPCDSLSSTPSNGFPNYNIYTYGAIVNLTGGSGLWECTEWVMSVEENARPNTENLGFGTDLFTEVRFNTKLAQDDSSPAFPSTPGFQPLIFTCDTTFNEVGNPVVDPDNLIAGANNTDSLAFISLQPLSGPNTPIPYVNGYSVNAPVRVWTGRVPIGQGPGGITPPANFPFSIDSVGTIRFTSGLAVIGSPQDEDNKFSISIGVESWRRINGGPRQKISTIRRDILITIFRCPSRPTPPQVIQGGVGAVTNIGIDSAIIVNATDTITVDACANADIKIDISDINGDSVTAFISNNQLPGQASISVEGMVIVPGTFTIAKVRLQWLPDASTVGGYYPVTIRLLDNGCPIPGRTDQPLILHVVKNDYSDVGLFTTNNNGLNDTLCVGQITSLVATTRRPATIGIPAQPAVYTYNWLQDPDNTIVRTNRDSAIVRPLRTTRYFLEVETPQGCIDTASIVVRVDPTNRATTEPDSVCAGESAVLNVTGRARRVGPTGEPIVYTYRWVDSTAIRNGLPTTLSNDSIQSPVATPVGTTRYYATVYSSLGCTDTTSIVVFSKGDFPVFDTTQNVSQEYRVSQGLTYGQNGVPSLAATNDNGGFRYSIRGTENLDAFGADTTTATPTVLGLTRTTTYRLVAFNPLGCQSDRTFTIVVPLNIPNIITPNGDKKNDEFVVEGAAAPEVSIFNRWGRKIREWSAYDNKWNGDDLPAGTYFYYVRDKENNTTYKGWVEIVR